MADKRDFQQAANEETRDADQILRDMEPYLDRSSGQHVAAARKQLELYDGLYEAFDKATDRIEELENEVADLEEQVKDAGQ